MPPSKANKNGVISILKIRKNELLYAGDGYHRYGHWNNKEEAKFLVQTFLGAKIETKHEECQARRHRYGVGLQ